MPIPKSTFNKEVISSAVGTPGVDSSGIKLGESIASFGNTLNREADQLTQLKISIDKQKQKAFDLIELSNKVVDIDTAYQKGVIELQNNYNGDEEGFIESAKTLYNSKFDEAFSNTKSSTIQNGLASHKASSFPAYQKANMNWLQQRKLNDTAFSVLNTIDGLSQTAGNTENYGQVKGLINSVNNFGETFQLLYGEKAQPMMKAQKQKIANNYLWNMMQKNPMGAGAILSSGEMDDVIDPDDKMRLLGTAQTAIVNKQKDDTFKDLYNGYTLESKLTERFYDGSLSYNELNDTIQDYSNQIEDIDNTDLSVKAGGYTLQLDKEVLAKEKKNLEIRRDYLMSLRDLMSASKHSSIDKSEAVVELSEDMSKVYQNGEVPPDVTLEQLMKVREKAMRYAKQGIISPATMQGVITKLGTAPIERAFFESGEEYPAEMRDTLKEVFADQTSGWFSSTRKIIKAAEPVEAGKQVIKNYIDKMGFASADDKSKVHANMLVQFYAAYYEREANASTPLTKQDAVNIVHKLTVANRTDRLLNAGNPETNVKETIRNKAAKLYSDAIGMGLSKEEARKKVYDTLNLEYRGK